MQHSIRALALLVSLLCSVGFGRRPRRASRSAGTLATLRARSGGVNHFETMWLDYRIKATREALGD